MQNLSKIDYMKYLFNFYLFFYYFIISKLPHSRFFSFFNTFRVWYLSKALRILPFDKKSKVEFNVYISDARKIRIGKYCRINENVFLQGDITIGNYVMIAPNVSIYSANHFYSGVDQPMVTYGNTNNIPVIIEDDVWIGRNVVILPGIRVESGSIIGANSVVTKNVLANSIVGGVPAKFIKFRK